MKVATAGHEAARPLRVVMVAAVLLAGAAGLSETRERYLPLETSQTKDLRPQATYPLAQSAPPPGLPLAAVNPLLALLLLSGQGGVPPPGHVTPAAACSPALLQQLVLAQYGRYLPYGLGSYGFYGGGAGNLHAAKVLGHYKYEDRL